MRSRRKEVLNSFKMVAAQLLNEGLQLPPTAACEPRGSSFCAGRQPAGRLRSRSLVKHRPGRLKLRQSVFFVVAEAAKLHPYYFDAGTDPGELRFHVPGMPFMVYPKTLIGTETRRSEDALHWNLLMA